MGVWKYWSQAYRDRSKPDDEGKFKNRKEIQKVRRENTIIGLVVFAVFIALLSLFAFLDYHGDHEETRNFLLVFAGIFVLMLALAWWTDSINSYLKADDLDPRYLREEEKHENEHIEDSTHHARRHERHDTK